MPIFSIQSMKKWMSIASIASLAACAGTRVNNDIGRQTADASSTLKIITAQLLVAEKTLRDQQTDQEIGSLLNLSPSPYTIDSGDILSIIVWDHPELAGAAMIEQTSTGVIAYDNGKSALPPAGFVVDHQGMVQFPYAGVLKLAGLTQEQAGNLLTSKLSRYIQAPRVTLRVAAYRSKRIYVDGEVRTPGLLAIDDIPMTLVEALNRAGGLLPTADQSRVVITRGGSNVQVNLLQLVQKGINPATILLTHGDVVHIISRDESKVFVSGEVITPKALTMHNGRLTLNEALGESGGINSVTGDGRQVYVVRKSGSESIVYQLDASTPGALAMAEGFELKPRDVVYVAASPLANWHRGISLLLPGSLSSAFGAVK